ncbi:MAG: hypothetical protein QOH10_351 [Actinomycetota bacterium]|nr:hypothetical protein [Actinomycetota bacterium]
MAAEVFRPQSAGRAVRTAFVLGVLIVVALVAAVGAVHQFSALVGDNTKDELSRYLDDNAHTTIKPSGAGFRADFPIPPERLSEQVSFGTGSVTAPRDGSLVDDEITFDAVWFDLPGSRPARADRFLTSFVRLQVRQLAGTRIALNDQGKIGRAIFRDFVVVSVDRSGIKRYYDERVVFDGRRVWFLRIGSRLRRDEAFRRFADSFALTT